MNIFPELSCDVEDWDVIVMGHLRVNRYFGESYDAPPRGDPSTCTSLMLRGRCEDGAPYVLLVDPTLRLSPEAYDFDINRRTGLRSRDVTHVYCTHHHLDHYEAFAYFDQARWLAARPVAELLREEARKIDGGRIQGVTGEFLPGARAVPLPGHTRELHGVAFRCGGKKILAAGDAVMTKYHFLHETTDFQQDPALNAQAAQSIRDMRESFDIVIPGHDNLIIL